jgi:hypothetical protein
VIAVMSPASIKFSEVSVLIPVLRVTKPSSSNIPGAAGRALLPGFV